MNVLRSTALFAVVTFLIAIFGASLLSTYFSFGTGQGLAGIIAWLGLILTYYKYRDSSETATDDGSANKQTDKKSADHGDKLPQLESSSGNEPSTAQSPETEHADAVERPTERPQSSLLHSNEDIIDEVEEKLSDRIQFNEDGTIEINADDLNLYSEMMLYVIAKRIASEYQLVETATVTVEELRQEVGERPREYNRMEVALFLDMAGGRLTPSHNVFLWERDDYNDLENIDFSVGLKKLSEITDWALEEQQAATMSLSIGLSNAAGWLSDAADTHQKMKKDQRTYSYYNPEEDFEQICDDVLTACSEAKAYPVEIRRDSNWKKFTRYSAGVLRGVDSVSHHLPIAQKFVENMKNIADEQRGW